MDTKTAIQRLKERIKDLSMKQPFLKRARKTSIPEEERCSLLVTAGVGKRTWGETFQVAAVEVHSRKQLITASLNLYHELRGSDYRHGKPEDMFLYEKDVAMLKREFELAS
jgi:hypothetical protein